MRNSLVLSLILLVALVSTSNAAFIPGVVATASSEHWAMQRGPGLVVDSSGMDELTQMHDNGWANMWLSGGTVGENQRGGTVIGSYWIQFDLGQAYQLDSMDIWNRSEESWPWFGMKDVTIEYSLTGSTDSADWASIFVGTIPLSNGAWTPAALNVPFSGVSARYVVVTAALGKDVGGPNVGDRNWFYDRGTYYNEVGLSEVRFYEVPEPITMALLALGGLAMLRRRK